MIISTIGSGKPVVGVIGCVHGDEHLGAETISLLKDVPLKRGTVLFILANVAAMQQNKRCLECDLNRSFPGDSKSHEGRIAQQLVSILKHCDYVIDIHSTTAKTENFIITTRFDSDTERLISAYPLKKAVNMHNTMAKGKSLIDHAKCGLSVEYEATTAASVVKVHVITCLATLGLIAGEKRTQSQERFLVYEALLKTESTVELKNFKETTFAGESFYPVLSCEKAYSDINCLKAKRIT